MSDPASLILSVANSLWNLRDQLNRARRDRRDRIAEYFASLSDCLGAVASSLREGDIPHGRCAEMEVYASKLPDTIGDVVGREEAADQARALAEAHNVEWLVADLGPDEPERETRLADIERAAGIFTALATTMRASR